MRRILALAAAACIAIIAMPAAPAHAAEASISFLGVRIHESHQGWCSTVKLPVAPADGTAQTWRVLVDFCQPFRFTRNVDVLTHGATYTHTYWDWPQQPDLYSYVGRALADGRATLNYDRIGNGESTRPASTEITMASDATVLHQLIDVTKALGFKRIHSVSHSYGSGVALAEAKQYHDVTTVILSGYLHRASNPAVVAGNYPANLDPQFQGPEFQDRVTDSGWLTSRPGVRGTSFHSPSSDPDVVAYDEAHKDLVSRTGLLDFLGQRAVAAGANVSNAITAPVLVLVGQQDAIFCYDPAAFNCADPLALLANEAPFYAATSHLKVAAVPESGHDLTLHPSAGASYAEIKNWILGH
jgi:pimeloyl-ACP methyl ester carboxylesterase